MTVCSSCRRGREACGYCHDVSKRDWKAICDCGLHDFGQHLTRCDERDGYRFVIALDYVSAEEPRAT